MNEHNAMCAAIHRRTVILLGDRVSHVKVMLRDHDHELGVGIQTPGGRRHAVSVKDWREAPDPESMADSACVALTSWLDALDASLARRAAEAS